MLQVISSSVADTQPVFDKILDSCQRLFTSAGLGISLVGDDGQVHLSANRGVFARGRRGHRPLLPAPDRRSRSRATRSRKRRVLHFPDLLGAPRVPEVLRQMAERMGNASAIIAPMLWQDRGVGAIHVYRQPPAPFADKEIGLLKTFADQAAIAIQNARLFNETQEALERQTASADVLRVISSSVADAQPVFERIMRSCQRLIESSHARSASWATTA